MDIDGAIQSKINIVNKALNVLNVPMLLQNSNFHVDPSISNFNYLKIDLKRNSNHVALSLIFTKFEFQINVDRVWEAFEWSNEQLAKSTDEVVGLLTMLFTHPIRIRYCGASYTKLIITDFQGNNLRQFKFIDGFRFSLKIEELRFKPIYEAKES
jgi:hypothetical protein